MEIPIIKKKLSKSVYVRPLEETRVNIYFSGNEVWLTQREIALLWGVQLLTVRKHLRNAYKKGKLSEEKITAKLQTEVNGVETFKTVYNLDAIKNIGDRINSALVLKFDEWLEKRKQALVKKN
ncbi:MAG TPA: hypothetical protein VHA74_03775 [Candidatus Dojkabacteria bacterium]|nr:hypothetical protein [Candidatus Dojkabacteria bacterium]